MISNNINNEFADTVTVLPVTSSVGKVYPFEVFMKKGIANMPGDSRVKVNLHVHKPLAVKIVQNLRLFSMKNTSHTSVLNMEYK